MSGPTCVLGHYVLTSYELVCQQQEAEEEHRRRQLEERFCLRHEEDYTYVRSASNTNVAAVAAAARTSTPSCMLLCSIGLAARAVLAGKSGDSVPLRATAEAAATAAAGHILLLAFVFISRNHCLKIQNIPGEFEELQTDERDRPIFTAGRRRIWADPVAIVGTCEYIFSEDIGILGDLVAGKGQTFGTLCARSMVWIGGKLHHGQS
ncbi:unnamed protein product [Mycena citricolor]|uniref:Glycosyl transferase 48 domain-containing protein n=1 Tax=Mycena citricolor TaxID=2018698 RepID=A0AAD2K4J6_9AGAR|nr:unnamed protein product [Mycena citricolor]